MLEKCSFFNYDEIQIPTVDFILATAVKIELTTMFEHLTPLEGEEKVICIQWISDKYFIGMCGQYKCCLVMSEAGGMGRHGSALVILDAIDRLQPHAVILCGIAFGLYPEHSDPSKSQVLGDVLVSTQSVIYEKRKINENEEIYRGPIAESGRNLAQAVNHFEWSWRYQRKKRRFEKGPILSGEKLVNSSEFREKLKAEFPSAIGGEMEGAGLYSAAARRNIEWLIVKAICDFAAVKGDSAHELAAKNACNFVAKFLEQPGLHAKQFGVENKENFKSGITASERNGNFEAFYKDVRQAEFSKHEKALKVTTYTMELRAKHGDNPFPKHSQELYEFYKQSYEVAKEQILSKYNDGCIRFALGKFDKTQFEETFKQEIIQIYESQEFSSVLKKNEEKGDDNPYKGLQDVYNIFKES